MPISGYGVLRGKPTDKQDGSARSPHYQVLVVAADTKYRIAINVKSQTPPSDVLYYVDDDFRHDILDQVAEVEAGFTASKLGGPALDFVRGNLFDHSRMRPLPIDVPDADNDLNRSLDAVIDRAISASDAEVFAFGQVFEDQRRDPYFDFRPGRGIHDIHMNQGNARAFVKDDGTWQDGGLLLRFPDADRWVAVFLAFQSQSFQTDARGHATGPEARTRIRRRPGRPVHPMAPLEAPPARRGARRATNGAAGGRWAPPDLFAPSTSIPPPTERPLKIYAFDPSAGKLLGNEMTISLKYEKLAPGPIGTHLAVIDYDGSAKEYYEPVDLDDPKLLIRGGLNPTECDPRFHQQMVYAVAAETLQRFEVALGRRVHWRRASHEVGADESADIRRLNLYPHAMVEPNAFYSPAAQGILFGYFKAGATPDGLNLPGQTVYTCLSHDIIAHETTHAVIDGIRRYFTEPTNIDVAAFHEAFADLVALFRHFSHEEALLDSIQKTGARLYQFELKPDAAAVGSPKNGSAKNGGEPIFQGEIPQLNPLVQLAMQFGQASGMHSGLRMALGKEIGPNAIKVTTEPHARGAILVSAVFDAYFSIYTQRAADLFRIYRAGCHTENEGELPGPLAQRLTRTASKTAAEFFTFCARALDYCPPVDITFGDFLRALVTAHLDLDPADPDGIRHAFMQAFRLRGILPDAASLSEESLCWPAVREGALPPVTRLLFGDPNGLSRKEKKHIGDLLRAYAQANRKALGFDQDPGKAAVEVPSFHPVFRIGPDGGLRIEMVVELVQTVRRPFDPESPGGTFPLRSGATLIISPGRLNDHGTRSEPKIRYVIGKWLSPEREERQRSFYLANDLDAGIHSERSTGRPIQSIELRDASFRDVELVVRDDQDQYTEVKSFAASKAQDPHYMVSSSGGKVLVRFGDGKRGRIPAGQIEVSTRKSDAERYRVNFAFVHAGV